MSALSTEDFYQFSFAISTYCDVLVSKIAFAYHENYIHMLKKEAQNKDDFISIATHELKTPVTSLKAFTQMVQRNFVKTGDKKSALYLAKMDVQLNRLTSLIGDLLDAIKINNGKLQYHKENFDFNELVLEIIEEMQLTTEKHRINKKLSASKTVFGDRSRIGQVLMNLLSNAIKYSPDADKINVATRTDKEQLTFSVQDFGIGITKTDQVKIFDRFQRVGNQNEFGGLGLGLFIAARIIKDHGGTIWVKSEKGNGATVYIRLPIKK